METQISRREEPRFEADLPVRLQFEDRCGFSHATNVSEGGLFVQSAIPCQDRELAHLTVRVPNHSYPLTFIAEVVHAAEPEPGESQGFGLKVLPVDAEEHNAWQHFVNNLTDQPRS